MSLYIKFTITERIGEMEFEHDMVAEIPNDTTADTLTRTLNTFLLDFYADSELEECDTRPPKVLTGKNTLSWISEGEHIKESHFSVLRQHMNNQTFNVNQYLTNSEFRLL